MLRIFSFFICLFCCIGDSFAQQAPLSTVFSFAPPVSDSSIIFLSNIFGVVDGVLSGTGSQLFGRMMQVFNAAVLALGSIVIMYTMVVGTLNTAQEGQFLGQKWSSIWIPIRSSIGVGLLIPKASGYCLMQIFVMWLVVQGVGAADKVWHAALQYLNTGGKIAQVQMSSSQVVLSGGSQQNPIFMGAETILSGQVCMYGMQKILERVHADVTALAHDEENPRGPCYQTAADSTWDKFCNANVPDFLATVNAISVQQANKNVSAYNVPMPNFTSEADSIYTQLNGLCGSLAWNNLTDSASTTSDKLQSGLGLTDAETDTLMASRAIAIQQMYTNLSIVAQGMVNNDPDLNTDVQRPSTYASYAANSQFGVVNNTSTNTVCNLASSDCTAWEAVPSSGVGVLLAGNELYNAIAAYDGIMNPILSLQQQMKNQSQAQSARSFLKTADEQGWMYAGGYFLSLVSFNGSPVASSNLQDTASGLETSCDYMGGGGNGSTPCSIKYPSKCVLGSSNDVEGDLCWFISEGGFNTVNQYDQYLIYLLQGSGSSQILHYCPYTLSFVRSGFSPSTGYVSTSASSSGTVGNFQTLDCSSTTLGYIGNSYFLVIPGQPSIGKVNMPNFPFALMMPSYKFPTSLFSVKCKAPYLFCIDMILQNGAVAIVFGIIYIFVNLCMVIISILIALLLVIPLRESIWPMIQQGMTMLSNVDGNPIINLANMGAWFIQRTFYTYLTLMAVAALGALPFVGPILNFLFAFFSPLYMAWLAYFFSVGFTTAYYVPFVPYMIFTFGVISWLFNVIEAMVAAPIMALGITTPEGEGILGKGEHGLMILMNVFLRPSMMVVGFMTATILTYVSIWILNSGFGTGGSFLTGPAGGLIDTSSSSSSQSGGSFSSSGSVYGINWGDFPFAQMIGCMVYIVVYVSMYTTLVQKVFTLIYILPDKIMRWMGGHGEQSEVQQWMQDTSQKVEQLSQATGGAFAKTGKGAVESVKALRKDNEKATSDTGGIANT